MFLFLTMNISRQLPSVSSDWIKVTHKALFWWHIFPSDALAFLRLPMLLVFRSIRSTVPFTPKVQTIQQTMWHVQNSVNSTVFVHSTAHTVDSDSPTQLALRTKMAAQGMRHFEELNLLWAYIYCHSNPIDVNSMHNYFYMFKWSH